MQVHGAMTALVTPMKNGEVDTTALTELVNRQIDAGIHGLVAVGTTGESATLTEQEAHLVIKTTANAANGRVPVIAGAGGNNTAKAIAMSKLAAEAGADGLLHVVPYYNKPTQAGLVAHFTAIADASTLPIILYNVPSRTVCDMLPQTIAELAKHSRIVSVKEATGNMIRASKVLELCEEGFSLLSGDDFTTLPLLSLGGHGVISVISNVMPKEMAGMCDAAAAGDWDKARALHFEMQPLLDLLFLEPNPVPTKAALAMMGQMSEDVRLPLLPATDGLKETLRAELVRSKLL